MTGAGRAFCAGVDFKDIAENDSNIIESREMTETFEQCKKPIIGAINSAAMTGGLELALYCDFLYAADSARFGDTHAKVGLMPTWGMSQKLPRIIGINRTREMSLSGNIIDASAAMQWGLVNKLCSKDTLLDETLTKAHSIAEHIQVNTQNLKKLMNEGWKSTLEQGLLLEEKYSYPHNRTVDLTALTQPTPEALREEIARCRTMTDKPFGVNITILPSITPPPYEDFAKIIIESGVKVVETAGRSPEAFMPAFKAAGIKVIHKYTFVRYALKAEN